MSHFICLFVIFEMKSHYIVPADLTFLHPSNPMPQSPKQLAPQVHNTEPVW